MDDEVDEANLESRMQKKSTPPISPTSKRRQHHIEN